MMSIEELLDRMRDYHLRRSQRDYRPAWLKSLIRSVSELFDPLADIGRVGYDCQLDESGWCVQMYLGTTEIVGGPRDGQVEPAAFRMDLEQLRRLFETVSRFEWFALSDSPDGSADAALRCITCIHGTPHGGEKMRLELLAAPPESLRPGLHCRPDGMMYKSDERN